MAHRTPQQRARASIIRTEMYRSDTYAKRRAREALANERYGRDIVEARTPLEVERAKDKLRNALDRASGTFRRERDAALEKARRLASPWNARRMPVRVKQTTGTTQAELGQWIEQRLAAKRRAK